MNQVRAIRQQRRAERIEELRRAVASLLANRPGLEVWLFGSWARGDWDARSDVDLIAIGATKEEAVQMADDLRLHVMADDVIALTHVQWSQCQASPDPLWRGIVRDAIHLGGSCCQTSTS